MGAYPNRFLNAKPKCDRFSNPAWHAPDGYTIEFKSIGISTMQNVRLAGSLYMSRLLGKPDLGYDYLLAISG